MKRWLFLLALVVAFAPVPAASQHPRLTVSPSSLHLSVRAHREGVLNLEAAAPNVRIEFDHTKSTCEIHDHIAVLLDMRAHPSPPGSSHYQATVIPVHDGTCEMFFKSSDGPEVAARIFVDP